MRTAVGCPGLIPSSTKQQNKVTLVCSMESELPTGSRLGVGWDWVDCPLRGNQRKVRQPDSTARAILWLHALSGTHLPHQAILPYRLTPRVHTGHA